MTETERLDKACQDFGLTEGQMCVAFTILGCRGIDKALKYVIWASALMKEKKRRHDGRIATFDTNIEEAV